MTEPTPVPQFPLRCGEDDMVLSIGSSSLEASTDVRCTDPVGLQHPWGGWSRSGRVMVFVGLAPCASPAPPDSGHRFLAASSAWGPGLGHMDLAMQEIVPVPQ